MTFKKYWSGLSSDEKQQLSERCGLTKDYMRIVSGGHRQFSTEAAKKVHAETNGKVALHKMLPGVWAA